MTTEALVKSFLTSDSCELHDRVRITNIINNLKSGYGKHKLEENTLVVIYPISKTRIMVYSIPLVQLSSEQLAIVK